jgi:hypothetical protein
MVATAVTLEDQFEFVVRSDVVLSEKCPVAVNCWVAATAMVGLIGLMSIEVSVGPLLLEPHEASIATSTVHRTPEASLLAASMDIPFV